ncbi:MAG: flavin reductase family protein, partial [Bacteroidota bacterium]
MIVDFATCTPQERYHYLTGAVGPRPIAFASTVNDKGHKNLSPFSFFNVFSASPPILIFAPVLRGRDGSSKDTLQNVRINPEVAISIVSHKLVQQMSLSSTEYPSDVNEFVKAGFTESISKQILPGFVKEATVSFECRVNEVKSLGSSGGAGQL